MTPSMSVSAAARIGIARHDVDQRVDAEFDIAAASTRLDASLAKRSISCLAGLGCDTLPRPHDVDDDEAECGGQRGGDEEIADRLAADPADPPDVAEAGDAERDRRKDQRHHHHEQHAQEDLPIGTAT